MNSTITLKYYSPSKIAIILCLAMSLYNSQIYAQKLWGLTAGSAGGGMVGSIFSISTSGTGFELHKKFYQEPDGQFPLGSLTQGTDGYFYGMCFNGGANNNGTIFKISSTGDFIKLRDLSEIADGNGPKGHLIQGTDGDFYGICSTGGIYAQGTIFKISSNGAFTKLKDLNNSVDGGYPQNSLIQGTDGIFYGMCYEGGTNDNGTIFKITSSGTFTKLRDLSSTSDGAYPQGALMQSTDGDFYGLLRLGGAYNGGTIFKITSTGTFTKLRDLSSASDGAYPQGALVQAPNGDLYGLCSGGGPNYSGTIFKISTISGTFTKLKNLSATTGSTPIGSLVLGQDGDFYGITSADGAYNNGTIFKITSSGTFTKLKDLLTFADGYNSNGSLTLGSDGNFYGMCSSGGKNSNGTIFKISSSGVLTKLKDLSFAMEGAFPKGSLLLASDGNFYGMCYQGGMSGDGSGTIFKISSDGTFTKLRDLTYDLDGANPQGNLFEANDGNLYGICKNGGTNGVGTIFKISKSGIFNKIKDLSSASEGAYPTGGLIQAKDGNFYGTCTKGGTNNYGTIFKISSSGNLTKLWDFSYYTSGSSPFGNLLQASDGDFYGTVGGGPTSGSIFKITSTGTFTKLIDLNFSTLGSYPTGGLLETKDGNLYGLCAVGGANSNGTLFKISKSGTFTKLKDFRSYPDGSNPNGSLIKDADENFYGLSNAAGAYGDGTIFKMSNTGTFSIFMALNGTITGINPEYTTFAYVAAPVISNSISSITGFVGHKITISGTGLLTSYKAALGDSIINIVSKTDTSIVLLMPNYTTSGFINLSTAGGNIQTNQFVTVKYPILTIAVSNSSKVYGSANPEFTSSVNGLLDDDQIELSYITDATDSSKPGTYLVYPSVTGNMLSTYILVTVNGTLTITKKLQEITGFPVLSSNYLTTSAPVSFANAAASSGLPISVTSSDINVVSVSGTNLIFISAGVTTITAMQQGDDYYFPANSIIYLVTVTNPLPTTISQETNKVIGSVYPNPNSGSFKITILVDQKIQAELLNNLGSVIRIIELNQNTTDVNGVQPGFYLLRIGNETKKILVE